MMAIRKYQVVFDAAGDVVQVKDVGPAESRQRIVAVLAASAGDAQKKAKVLFGGEGL
jgi:hypothetical protein